ncbi:DNA mismatch repair protein MutS [Oscillibacter sp. MSJ-31]|uniref:DNA mismatch repair protein MutS n=1 Tax=Oscillibacter sp. MSJ-31 TaxID=2841526 RepID=UPI001C0FDD31|nr:DNA mismatch repair protein MutS [Oscillibacter sp. MSJ-31]MBU5456936.1 DNA mismatch repair protein MutS [Oscillibacter sp. MSJ-31]
MKKKHTNVDIIAELKKLVDSHVDSYKEDFDIDKRIIRCAAESKEPEDKVLMWFCRPHGTHCLRENQVFIQGTRDHNTYRFYAEQTRDECIARVIIPKEVRKGKVYGDVFEVNYREQAANVAQNSVAPDHDRLTFADGYMLDAPCRSSFDAAMALVGEHGSVKTHRTLPKDADALAEVLTKQKSRRDRLPEAERTEVLAPLPVAELRKYEAVKQAHPEALVCFAQNGYFELYGKDAEKAAPLLGTKVLEKKVRGKSAMPVTGFRESAWVAASKKLWQSGADVFLSKDGDTFKDLKGADYIPVGATLMMDGMKCRIDAVDYTANEVKLTDITKPDKPFKFSEDIAYVRNFVEDAGIAIYDTIPKKPAARESIREKLKASQKAQPSQPQKPQKLKGKDMEL